MGTHVSSPGGGGSGGGGGGGTGGGSSPWRIEVNCVLGMAPVDAVAGAGAWTVQGDTGELTGFVLSQNGAGDLDDYIAYDLAVSAGTWDFEAIVQSGGGVGIIHFEADDGDGVFTDYGNVDGYTAGGVFNQRLRIPGMVIVGTASLRRVRLKMASKNAVASGYGLNITAFTLQRTA